MTSTRLTRDGFAFDVGKIPGRGPSISIESGGDVKSLITNPSFGFSLQERGIYQVKGIAWSGAGKIIRVDISADGGQTWAEAALDEHVLPKCLTRFRAAWRWDGSPSIIMSRAIDEQGNVQPTRNALIAERAAGTFYHYNGIQAWQIGEDGEVSNVHV